MFQKNIWKPFSSRCRGAGGARARGGGDAVGVMRRRRRGGGLISWRDLVRFMFIEH